MALTTVDGSLISSGAITLTTQVTGTLPEANGGTGTTVGYCGFKNRIINGAMMIDQRNAGAAWGTSISGYTVDRWACYTSVAGKLNGGQNYNSITSATGFPSYIGVQSQSAYSISATDYFAFQQRIEGNNIADLGWGAAGAVAVTLSFWVRSSLTGTFSGALQNSAQNRSYPFIYTISAANTWEQKSITVAGDTSGTWLTTNGSGIILTFGLGIGTTYSGTAGAWAGANYFSATGATSVVGTSGATFYITGVQLEKGSTATSFDYRPYGTELALCQRYFIRPLWNQTGTTSDLISIMGLIRNASAVVYNYNMPVQMRAAPSFGVNNAAGFYSFCPMVDYGISSFTLTHSSSNFVTFQANSSGMSATLPAMLNARNVTGTNSYIEFSAEL